MTVFMTRKKSKSKNIVKTTAFISFIFKVTNLLIVNLFDLTICKLVIFFEICLVILILFLIFDNRLDYLFFCENSRNIGGRDV